MRIILCLLLWAAGNLAMAGEPQFPHERLFQEAARTPGWEDADTIGQLLALLAVAKEQDIVADPFPDRYTITHFCGPVDWVHFLEMAKEVYTGADTLEGGLFRQWEREGGKLFEAGKTATYPTAATPDDLPSNALGALFGEELKQQPKADFVEALRAFIEPMRPVPDAIAKQYSRNEIVLGLKAASSNAEWTRSHEWFTAEPLNVTALINQASLQQTGEKFGPACSTGREAMAQAGFQIVSYQGRPILIDRIRQP